MEDHAFNRLSFVNGKVYRKYGKKNAGQKNIGHYQKNFDYRETKIHINFSFFKLEFDIGKFPLPDWIILQQDS